MKKFIIALLAIAMCLPSVKAQKHKGEQEISANYSVWSTTAMMAVLSNVMGSMLTWGIYTPDNIDNSADIGLTYRYYLSNRFALGASAMYMNNSYNAMLVDAINNGQVTRKQIGSGITHFYKFSLEGKLDYYRNDWFSCYGFLGLGFDIINTKYTPDDNALNVTGEDQEQTDLIHSKQNNTFPWPNFQVTPIGLSVGKDFGGFLDLGVGYKGILNLGVYYRF
ncbi:hypothetical protein FACS189413_08560 [Bacteroidia bacterium]|nr:hypothetical protein FACS189413_08560 [Bacteroidia bacterium]